MKYYTEEECLGALQRAKETINLKTESCKKYTRGINDCFALFAEYDLELRGKSKARDVLDFEWESTREFVRKLMGNGYGLKQYAEYCGYEVIPSKRPMLGDIAFEEGAMINDGKFWVSTKEDNSGCHNLRQSLFLERNILVLARPIRS